jgi:hypothetical protein
VYSLSTVNLKNMKKNKMGRPPLPKGKAKKVVFAVKLSSEDSKALEASAKESGQTKSELIRERLLGRPQRPLHYYENFPVVCANAQELYGGNPDKIAVFQVEYRGKLHVLSGRFMVHEQPGKVFLVVRSYGSSEVPAMDYCLDQEHVDSIAPLPELAPKAAYIIQEPFLSHRRKQISAVPPDSGG